MSVQSQRAGKLDAGTPGTEDLIPAAGTGSDDSTVTQTPTTDGDATSGAAADCSMASDTGGGGDSPGDYAKHKYHSSKMDLNLKILRDQMANLTSSGSSLSRQMASMHRNIQEIKDDDDEAVDADSEYESDDEQKQASVRDAVDTEDDVNKMSDFEKDCSEPKFKRSLSSGSRGKKSKAGARDPNANGLANDGSQPRHSRQDSPESCADSDSECSQCLCCNSMASYSSTPWRYVSRGEGSTMDEDSDSSEYFTDESEYSTTSNLPSTDLHKRLSPFYCPSDQGETLPPSEEGRFDDAEDHRMSPLGCESPGKYHSQPDLPGVSSKSDSSKADEVQPEKSNTESEKPGTEVEAANPEEEEKIAKASSLIGMFKEQESKAKQQEIASVAKAKRVEELRQKNSEIRLKNEKKRKAELEAKLKNKANFGDNSEKSSPLVSDNEESEKVNIKDRINNFGGQKKNKDTPSAGSEEKGSPESEKTQNFEKGTNTELDSVQQMPDVIPDVSEGKDDQKDKLEAVDVQPADHQQHKSHKSKSKLVKTTIEIPISFLPEQIVHPEHGMTSNQPTMMTFQVRPGDIEAMGGPILVSRSPKPKRKMSKTIVRLSSTDSSPASVSESTLVSDADTVRIGVDKPSGHSHHVCPHCHKKNKPGESKRVVKVLQLQPVPESPEMLPTPTGSLPGDSTQIFQQPGGRVIKMIPSKRHNTVQRQESSGDGVVFRFNMGIPNNAPLQVGDYIRIPIQPQQEQLPQVTRIQHSGGGGGVVIRTGGQPRRQQEVITFRQSSHPAGDIRVQQSEGPSSGVTVLTSQPGVRVMPSKGGGVRLVFGS